MYRETEHIMHVSGIGETKQGAFQQALKQMKADIAKELSDILLQIEPLDVNVVSAAETSYTERFLGILFPRTRTRYEITLKINVKVRSVKLSEIEFTEKIEKLSPFQRILRMR